MKGLKRLLVFVMSLSMVMQPGFKGYVLAQDREPWYENEHRSMPVHQEGFHKNRHAYQVGEGTGPEADLNNEVANTEEEVENPAESDYGDNLPKGVQDKLDKTGEVPGKGLHKGWTQGHGYGRHHGESKAEEESAPVETELPVEETVEAPEDTAETPAETVETLDKESDDQSIPPNEVRSPLDEGGSIPPNEVRSPLDEGGSIPPNEVRSPLDEGGSIPPNEVIGPLDEGGSIPPNEVRSPLDEGGSIPPNEVRSPLDEGGSIPPNEVIGPLDEGGSIPPNEVIGPLDEGGSIPPNEVRSPLDEGGSIPPNEVIGPLDEGGSIPPNEVIGPLDEDASIPPNEVISPLDDHFDSPVQSDTEQPGVEEIGNPKEINPDGSITLTPEQQENYKVIFGADPVTMKVVPPPENVFDGPIVYNFYDKDGNLVGSVANGGLNPVQYFRDKDGNKIDVAAKLNDVDTDTAAGVIKSLNKPTAEAILADLDNLNPTKANEIRIKCCINPNLETMTPDEVADYLTKLNDPAKAAKLLGEQGRGRAAKIIGSSNMDAEVAAQILSLMDSSEIVVMLAESWFADPDNPSALNIRTYISPEKAGEILSLMTPEKAADVVSLLAGYGILYATTLGHFSVDGNEVAIKILQTMDSEAVADIFLAKNGDKTIITTDMAAGFFADPNFSITKAAEILIAIDSTDPEKAEAILSKMDDIDIYKAVQIREKMGYVIDVSKMTDDQIVEYLGRLGLDDPVKAASELLKLGDDRAVQVLNNENMWPFRAACIFYAMDPESAGRLMVKMDPAKAFVIMTNLGHSPVAKIFSVMADDKAAGFLANDAVSVDSAVWILIGLKASNVQKLKTILTALDAINPTKADQIGEKLGIITNGWLNDLGTLTPGDAATMIAVYVTDEATAKEVADALGKLDPLRAALIISQSNMPIQTAAQVFNQMSGEQVAGILDSAYQEILTTSYVDPLLISRVKSAGILSAMNQDKAVAVLEALPAASAGNILFATSVKQPMTDAKITVLLTSMNADSAAEIINIYVDPRNGFHLIIQNGTLSTQLDMTLPERVAGIFSNMLPQAAAAIFASDKISVENASRILTDVKNSSEENYNNIMISLGRV
jgi:flagellar motility protein MotE (MotC chaperone)